MFHEMQEDLPPNFPSELLSHARSLQPMGINQLVWPFPIVLQVVAKVAEGSYAILGGDVYRSVNAESMEIVGDTWWQSRERNGAYQPWATYVTESADKARSYIEAYHERNGDRYWYSLAACDESYFDHQLGKLPK